MEGRDDCLFCLHLLCVYNASWIEVFLSQLIYNIYFDDQNKIVTVMDTVISSSKVQLLFKLHLSNGATIQSKYSVLRLCDTLNKLIVSPFCLLPISFLLAIFCQSYIYIFPTTVGNTIHSWSLFHSLWDLCHQTSVINLSTKIRSSAQQNYLRWRKMRETASFLSLFHKQETSSSSQTLKHLQNMPNRTYKV